jgi:hypothetical protein
MGVTCFGAEALFALSYTKVRTKPELFPETAKSAHPQLDDGPGARRLARASFPDSAPRRMAFLSGPTERLPRLHGVLIKQYAAITKQTWTHTMRPS